MRVTIDVCDNGVVIDHQDPNSDECIQTVVEELVNETQAEYGRRVLHRLMTVLGLCDSESRYSEERLFVCVYPGDKSTHEIVCPLCFSIPVTGEESQVAEKPKRITVLEALEEKQEDLAGAGWQSLADELEPAGKKAAATRELNSRLTNLGVLVGPDYGQVEDTEDPKGAAEKWC